MRCGLCSDSNQSAVDVVLIDIDSCCARIMHSKTVRPATAVARYHGWMIMVKQASGDVAAYVKHTGYEGLIGPAETIAIAVILAECFCR